MEFRELLQELCNNLCHGEGGVGKALKLSQLTKECLALVQ